MNNLICFPHYTCGGLLCDILNDTFSAVGSNGGLENKMHFVGKISDTDTVVSDYDPFKFLQHIAAKNIPDQSWIGTHCWPKQEILKEFNKIIVVTTTTYKSKIYRWTRSYHHYFAPQWTDLVGMDLVDKARETAKNYIIPFEPVYAPNVFNLEFAEVVENTQEFCRVVDYKDHTQHTDRWRQINSFLYDLNFWQSDVVNYFHQAEVEINLGRYYLYR